MIDSTLANAPAGSESAFAVMKNAVSAASTAFESVQKAVKQATEMAESNFNAMTNQAAAAVKSPAKKR